MPKGRPPRPIEERFRKFFVIQDECWIWVGAKNKRTGYGKFSIKYNGLWKVRAAHRVSWQLFKGGLPTDGREIDHLCNNRLCVNPAHLRAATKSENLMRSPKHPANVNRAKTHCPHGHKYTPANTRIDEKGWRECRLCDAASQRRRRLAQRR